MTSNDNYDDPIDEFEAFQIRDAESRSSSPPNGFDVNIKSQYEPICDLLDDSMDNDDLRQSTSPASSLTIESDAHDYNTSPVILSSGSRDRVIRCPVCEKPMRTFYCAKCIQEGNFVTIENLQTAQEEFRETVKSKLALGNIHMNDVEPDKKIDEEELAKESLRLQVRALKKKRDTLQNLYVGQKSKLESTRDTLKKKKSQLDAEKKSNKSMKDKIGLISNFINERKSLIHKRTEKQRELLDDHQQYAQRRVFQLTNDIFPIDEINLLEQGNSFYNNMETSPLLTFSDGSHHQFEQQTAYSIVEPWLPSNGDYSAYSLWVNENSDQNIPTTMSERNPAFRIGAGLAYATQLVKNLATYLDVILPAKMDLDSFNGKLLDDARFSYNVAKLNVNVVHLCVTQGVDVSLLKPHQTLKNLSLLFNFNTSDIGRRPILDFLDSSEVAARIEEQLAADLSLVQEDFHDFSKLATEGDDDDVSDSEWEISDTINPSEMQMAIEQSIQQNSYISRLPLRLLASFWSTDRQ